MAKFVNQIVVLVTLAAVTYGLKIKYKDCGSKDATVNFVDITPCSKQPCVLQHNHNYSIALDFDSKADSKSLKAVVHGIIGGIPVPFPIPEPDACKQGVTCPVKSGDHNLYNSTLFIDPHYPNINVVVEWELKDAAGKDMVCVEFPLSLMN